MLFACVCACTYHEYSDIENANPQDRDGWVDAIEQQILSSLQANDIGKNKVSTHMTSTHAHTSTYIFTSTGMHTNAHTHMTSTGIHMTSAHT